MSGSIDEKVAHVLAAKDRPTRGHLCHWPGCKVQVEPALWGCRPHWFTLPKSIRGQIWATYEIGQETRKTPSLSYIAAAAAAQEWIRKHIARQVLLS